MSKRLSRRRTFQLESLEARVLLAGDLVAQWRAQDLVGLVSDSQPVPEWPDSVSGILAKAGGNPSLVEKAIGGRATLRFDPSDQKDWFSVVAADSPVSNADNFSVAVLFSTSATDLAGTTEFWHDGIGLVHANRLGFGKDWGIALNASGQATAGFGGGFLQPVTSVMGERPLNDGEPHTVLMTREGGTVTIYVDDAAPVSETGIDTGARDSLNLEFGLSHDQREQLDASIAEIRIYDGSLSRQEARSEISDIEAFYNNHTPNAMPDSYVVDEDAVLFVSPAQGVLANDTDVESDALTAVLVDAPTAGDVVFKADGSFLYDPPHNFFGSDTFTYAAVDFRPADPTTVTIEVRPTYDAPVGNADEYTSVPGRLLNIPSLVGVLANDTNVDRQPLVAQVDSAPEFGVLSLAPDGSFTFDPQASAGRTTFTYRINDGISVSDKIPVRLIINSAPIANDDNYATAEDNALIVGAGQGLLSNDRDAEFDALTTTLVSDTKNGALTLSDDGSFIYQPSENYFGSDSFTYRVSDGVDTSVAATVQLSVESVNDTPVASDDAYFASVDETLEVAALRGVLSNDTDVEPRGLTAQLVMGPQNGDLTLEDDGSFQYQPNRGFAGEDSFAYEARDADGAASSGTVRLFVGDAPITINEFMAANGTVLETRTRSTPDDSFRGEIDTPDWVELYNRTSTAIDISGFHLTDSPNNLIAWSFPDGTQIPAAGYLVIFLSGVSLTDRQLDENGSFHASIKLDAKGDYLALTSPNGVVLDEIAGLFPPQVADVSFGQTPEGFFYQTEPTPGAPNSPAGFPGIADTAEVSVPAGYYEDPILVAITSQVPDSTIRYTLDGSTPTDANGQDYSEPLAISKTTLLRTRVFKEGLLASASKTYSYLYLDDVLAQPENPAGFPPNWERAGAADYEVDPRIATDTQSAYFDADLRAALQSHDAISIVTDMDNLFDRTTGIYTNPQQQGVAWERPASMELISADGDIQFQINAGLRIQGGASRNPNRPKHNMRFLFKEQYGESKLEFPFFDDSPVETFDTLILRGGNGDSWFHPNATQQSQAQYIRDQWHKRTQQLMGHTFVPQRYIHLYINGLYWGFYHTFEKPNAAFFAERFGGVPDDYDVLQHQNGIVDGTRDAWNEIMRMARENPDTDETFEQLQQEVDMPALIEYLLLNFYSGNVDWDQNNWFGGRQREDGKFIFFTWDAERTFLGARDNRTTATNSNQPTDLHRRLSRANEEYRLMFADMAHRHFFNNGLLTPESASLRWQAFADEIELPLSAESARWGDNKRPQRPYTADVEWKRELERLMTTYFPGRTETVLSQLRRADLYPDVVAPAFNQHGGQIEEGFELSISAPEGIVYFTNDGSDPRLKGGDISPAAQAYNGFFAIAGDTHIKSRTFVDGTWSALNAATFLVPASPASAETLRVTEINYNPSAPTSDEIAAGFDNNNEFEFIELLNIGRQPIDLSAVEFVSGENGGVEYNFQFASIDRLAPGDRILVVENVAAFSFRYGDDLPVAGAWSGRLNNGGETIAIASGGEVIQQFVYDDEWHPSTDGDGHTLEIIEPSNGDLDSWSQSDAWRPSEQVDGTPGSDRVQTPVPGDSNHDGVFNSPDLVIVFRAGEYEDDITGNSTFEEGDWNGDGDFDTQDFVFVFQAATYVAEAHSVFGNDELADYVETMTDRHRKQRFALAGSEDNQEFPLDTSSVDFLFHRS